MLCFRKFLAAKKFMDKKGGGGPSNLSVDFFCLPVPKQFVEKPFSAVLQKISRSEKVCGKEGWRGIIETFRREIFVSRYRNIS